jgi:hypothetical protein
LLFSSTDLFSYPNSSSSVNGVSGPAVSAPVSCADSTCKPLHNTASSQCIYAKLYDANTSA